MNETNISRRPMRLVTGLFGVLLALSVACNGGPTAPSDDDRVRMYRGGGAATSIIWRSCLTCRRPSRRSASRSSGPELRGQQPEKSTA